MGGLGKKDVDASQIIKINDLMQELEKIYSAQKEMFILGYVLDLLDWDMQTYMPEGGAESKAEQIAYLSKLIHEKTTSEELWKSIKVLTEPKIFNKLCSDNVIVSEFVSGVFLLEITDALNNGNTEAIREFEARGFDLRKIAKRAVDEHLPSILKFIKGLISDGRLNVVSLQ